MCYQRFEYFTCGHTNIEERKCEAAPEHAFHQKVLCDNYHADSHRPHDEKCGIGRYYCQADTDGPHLDSIHQTLDRAQKLDGHYARVGEEYQHRIANVHEVFDKFGTPQGQRETHPALIALRKHGQHAGTRRMELMVPIQRLQRQIEHAKYHFLVTVPNAASINGGVAPPLIFPPDIAAPAIPAELKHELQPSVAQRNMLFHRSTAAGVKSNATPAQSSLPTQLEAARHQGTPPIDHASAQHTFTATIPGKSVRKVLCEQDHSPTPAPRPDRRAEIAKLAEEMVKRNRLASQQRSALPSSQVIPSPKRRGGRRSVSAIAPTHKPSPTKPRVRRSSRIQDKDVNYYESSGSSLGSGAEGVPGTKEGWRHDEIQEEENESNLAQHRVARQASNTAANDAPTWQYGAPTHFDRQGVQLPMTFAMRGPPAVRAFSVPQHMLRPMPNVSQQHSQYALPPNFGTMTQASRPNYISSNMTGNGAQAQSSSAFARPSILPNNNSMYGASAELGGYNQPLYHHQNARQSFPSGNPLSGIPFASVDYSTLPSASFMQGFGRDILAERSEAVSGLANRPTSVDALSHMASTHGMPARIPSEDTTHSSSFSMSGESPFNDDTPPSSFEAQGENVAGESGSQEMKSLASAVHGSRDGGTRRMDIAGMTNLAPTAVMTAPSQVLGHGKRQTTQSSTATRTLADAGKQQSLDSTHGRVEEDVDAPQESPDEPDHNPFEFNYFITLGD